jgi:hypothetical protein
MPLLLKAPNVAVDRLFGDVQLLGERAGRIDPSLDEGKQITKPFCYGQ